MELKPSGFLGAAAALAALPHPDDAADEPASTADGTAEEPADAADTDDPLDGLYSSVYAEGVLDGAATLDPQAGELWTGHEHVPAVDLHVRCGMGDVCVTLDEAAGLALAEQLIDAFDDGEDPV